jgi:hypothetical protein
MTRPVTRHVAARCAALLALGLAAPACTAAAAASAPPAGAPAPDPGPVAAELQRATQLPSPRQIAFAWELDEAGAKLRGRGVLRAQPADRLRLDLFGPRGETYLAAALVGEEARIPPAVAERFPLPSPALLWGALGVVRPPAGATLLGASRDGDATTVRYQLGDGTTLEFRSRNGRLDTLRRLERGGVRESVQLSWADGGTLRRTEYRDWAAYRTLTLTPESSTDVASFPEETWSPPGTGR